MRHYGLIGKSLGHSFSESFFTAKFEAEEIDANYKLYELDSIDQVERLIEEHELSGFNVTIPYKEQIIPHLDELSDEAKEIGAVNCVVVRDGKKIGHNTDVMGIEASLHWLDLDPDSRVLILGTGGASKAVQYVLRKFSIPYTVVSRNKERGDMTYDELSATTIAEHRVIINATPVGTFPDVDAPNIDYASLTADHKLFDLVYNPAETLFLKQGKAAGASTMNGMLMLQTQAIASWHLWKE